VFDHVGIRVSDYEASVRFYRTVLATLDIEVTFSDDGLTEWEDFALSPTEPERPVARGLHVGFIAPSREHAGSFPLDPDGNSSEAVHHENPREDGWIDHLRLRTDDMPAIRRFYQTLAPVTGFEVRMLAEDHVQIAGPTGSLSYVAGPPTENVHIAFGTDDDAAVEAFHRVATEAGYRDNGAPGERPHYHEGYYGAFVLDPDGHNIELVNHHR
jgi:catechol 2,3-dioxygenase-like lactoylglutathione lyase family enzyme